MAVENARFNSASMHHSEPYVREGLRMRFS